MMVAALFYVGVGAAGGRGRLREESGDLLLFGTRGARPSSEQELDSQDCQRARHDRPNGPAAVPARNVLGPLLVPIRRATCLCTISR
jgi:hypothetical protein